MQRKELSKEDEASMNVEVNFLQQRLNKIELKTKEKKLHSQKQEENKKMRRINATKH